MRTHWILAALLSSALVAGCGDRGTQKNETPAENNTGAPAASTDTAGGAVTPQATAPAPAASSNWDAQGIPPRRSAAASDQPPAAPRSSALSNRAPSQAASTAPAVPAARWREVTLPAGTALPLELTTAVSSETAAVETPVSARLRQAVSIDGVTALPAGTVFHGNVIDVERSGRVQGRARLSLRFMEAEVDGERTDVRTNPITFEAEATKGEDATKVGAGAGIGAIVGGIVGGGKGAAKGAAIGGAAGTGVVLATRGKEVELASGADLAATLASPATLRVPNR